MLRVMTYNILTGGVDGDDTGRLGLIQQVIAGMRPDVLAVQEANEFESDGYRRLFAIQETTGLQGSLRRSGSGFHGALFLRPPWQMVGLEAIDAGANRSVIGTAIAEPGGMSLSIRGVHLHPRRADVRFAGAMQCLAGLPDLILGDFNSVRAEAGGEPADGHFDDERTFAALESLGYVDLFRRFHPGEAGATFRQAVELRLDYIFAARELAQRAVACEIVRTAEAEHASDHYPLVADFDLG